MNIEQGEVSFYVDLCPDPDGGYSTSAPELKGVLSEGDSVLEAIGMTVDAFCMLVQSFITDGQPIPFVDECELEPGSNRYRVTIKKVQND